MSQFYKSLLLAALVSSGAVCSQNTWAQSQKQTFTKRVAAADDDVEESAAGSMDFSSSDLELVDDAGDNGANQTVGIRFTGITIPSNAIVTKAYIQFSVDETGHTAATNLVIKGHLAANSPAFVNNSHNVSARAKTTASVTWAPAVWGTANATGPDQATPDLKTVVQEIIQQQDWQSGNALSFEITGTGRRNAHSYNGRAADAPQLVIEYFVPVIQSVSKRIATGNDDAEESATGAVDLTSSDLELVDDSPSDWGINQTVGMRFTGLNIPKNATITKAYIQFSVDETQYADATNLTIKGEAADNAAAFASTANNLSSRAKTTAGVNWAPAAWPTANAEGTDQATPDLTAVVQEIVSRQGWQSGNAIALLVNGTGRRNAHSYNGNSGRAPQLVVEYYILGAPVGTLPIAKNSIWMYHDKGQDLGTSWKDKTYDDSNWDYGSGILGYSDPAATTLSFGTDGNNKYPTYYFRHKFNVEDAQSIDSLLFDVLHDDGIVVYLNGVEQFRRNMPTGDITYNTWAPVAIDGGNERTYFNERINNADLVDGENVLAVEVHQNRANSSDLSFDLSLTPKMKTDASVFAMNDTWKYLDNGSDQGTAWTAPSFDDASWASGSAAFGYGNGDEATTVSYGSDASNKHITTYFRKNFTATNLADYQSLEISLVRDDAAVVYLNGTEVLRSNLMAGELTSQTTAVTFVEGSDETIPVIAYIDKQLLQEGTNTIAVEVHKHSAMDTDLRFNMGMRLLLDAKPLTPVTTTADCDPNSSDNIGCFTSVKPSTQTQSIVFPSDTHTFQEIAKSGVTTYTGTTQTIPGNLDFTGYIPTNGSSKQGYLSLNHENSPGGVSLLNLNLNEKTMLWEVNNVQKVDFAPVQSTVRNCSGGVTPWGTVITSEENTGGGDTNNDGYQDIGWQVEIDPATGQIKDYNDDGQPDKLWRHGRMNHENIAVGMDRVTTYQAEDGGTSCVYKFVADQPGNLSEGTLYVLVRSTTDPATGTWVQVPNTTPADCNNVSLVAGSLGGTNWSSPEDVEFGPDGKMYFTSKGSGTIWRFKDDGMTVSAIEAWVTNKSYPITHKEGVQNENWGTGIDNLTFDGEGNLWSLQDGGRNHLWVVRPDHTPENPHVELFMTTPAGSEPTGLTFSPDFRYGFISMQHPSGSNTQTKKDAAGNDVQFNRDITFVFARKQYLGAAAITPEFELGDSQTSCVGEEVELKAFEGTDAVVKWNDGTVGSVLTVTAPGTYTATAYANNGKTYTDEVEVSFENPVVNLGEDRAVSAENPITLDAGEGFSTYLWSDGSTERTLTVTTAGSYSVTATTLNGCVATDAVEVTTLTALENEAALSDLLKVLPNPFKGSTKVELTLPKKAQVTLEVFDLTGRRIKTLANEQLAAGEHQFLLDLAQSANGVYILNLRVNGHTISRRILNLNN